MTEPQTPMLSGVRVVDLSCVLGAPFATQVLADHGAEVIKIEPPQGDDTRYWGPPFIENEEGERVSAAYFEGCNRGKRGLSLDLKSEGGRAILMRLLQGADGLVHNMKPGGMEALGLGAAMLAAECPDLIVARLSGFGSGGAYGDLPGYDAVIQAMTGMISVNGEAGSEGHRVGVSIVDMAAGLYLTFGIAAALFARTQGRGGRHLEVSLYDAGFAILHPGAANWLMGAMAPRCYGNAHPNITPYDLYPTRTDPIFLGVGNDRQFARLCAILGRDDLAADARFATNAERTRHREALNHELIAALRDEDAEDLGLRLMRAGVPAGPRWSLPKALEKAEAAEPGRIVRSGEGYAAPASPLRAGGGEPAAAKAPPRFGEDTRAVLAEAGFTDDEIDAAIARGDAPQHRR